MTEWTQERSGEETVYSEKQTEIRREVKKLEMGREEEKAKRWPKSRGESRLG